MCSRSSKEANVDAGGGNKVTEAKRGPCGLCGGLCLFLRKPRAMECCKQGSVSQGAPTACGEQGSKQGNWRAGGGHSPDKTGTGSMARSEKWAAGGCSEGRVDRTPSQNSYMPEYLI